jgi:hypothetical protein
MSNIGAFIDTTLGDNQKHAVYVERQSINTETKGKHGERTCTFGGIAEIHQRTLRVFVPCNESIGRMVFCPSSQKEVRVKIVAVIDF